MPSDLGYPLNGKIRNNCRPEHDMSEYESKTTRVAVEALSTVPAPDQDWKINYVLRAGQVD